MRLLPASLVAFLVLACAGTTAHALTGSEERCLKRIAQETRLLAAGSHETIVECNNDDVSDRGCVAARRDREIARLEESLRRKLATHCRDADLPALGFPGPCVDGTGGAFSAEDLAGCLIATIRARVNDAVALEYPALAVRTGDLERCQHTIGRQGQIFIERKLRARTRCLELQAKGKLAPLPTVACVAEVPSLGGPGTGHAQTDQLIERAIASLRDHVGRRCGPLDLAGLGFPGLCGAPTARGFAFDVEQLADCLVVTHEAAADQIVTAAVPIGAPQPTPTVTATPEPSPTPTETATASTTPTETTTPTATPEPTETATPEATPEPTETATPEVTPDPTETATPEATPEPTETATPEVTPEPTETATPEATPEPTETATPESTPDPTETATPEATPEPTETATATPTATPEASPTLTATPEPTGTPTPTSTETATPEPTATGTPEPTTTPVVTVTVTIIPDPTVTPTPVDGACPTRLELQGNEADIDLDLGWNGSEGHDIRGPFVNLLTFDLVGCAGPDCGTCALELVSNAGDDNRRCRGNTSIACNDDNDCGANGPCRFFLGPPLPIPAAGGTCMVTEITDPPIGETEVATGTIEVALALRTAFFLGNSTESPCPTCVGDPTPGDGTRDGSCSAGARSGLECDGTASSTLYGSTLSLDCPPSSIIVGATSYAMTLDTNGATRTLSAASPNCRAIPSFECFCDTCAAPGLRPCASDADCIQGVCAGGTTCSGGPRHGLACTVDADCASTCGGPRCLTGTQADIGRPCTTNGECGAGGSCGVPGAPTNTNACVGLSCEPNTPPDNDSIDEGQCTDGLSDGRCAIEQFRPCTSNGDCNEPGDTCVSSLRQCFPDNGILGGSVSVGGAADAPVAGIANPTLGALFCVPPTGQILADTVLSIPSLGRLTLPATAVYSTPIE